MQDTLKRFIRVTRTVAVHSGEVPQALWGRLEPACEGYKLSFKRVQ